MVDFVDDQTRGGRRVADVDQILCVRGTEEAKQRKKDQVGTRVRTKGQKHRVYKTDRTFSEISSKPSSIISSSLLFFSR
jgi:hypothetical protein